MAKVKYIKTKDNQIIVFPAYYQHSDFKHFKPVSAGFIGFGNDKDGLPSCSCYGKSVSLGLDSNEKEDTKLAMDQIMGYGYF